MKSLNNIKLPPGYVGLANDLGIHSDWKRLCLSRAPTFEQQAFYCILRGRPITTMIKRKHESKLMMLKLRGTGHGMPVNTSHIWENVIYKISKMGHMIKNSRPPDGNYTERGKRLHVYWYNRYQVEFPFKEIRNHDDLTYALLKTLSEIFIAMNREHWAHS